MEKTRFGVEVFLNNLFKRKKRRKVALEGLMGLYKYEKHPSVAVREIINEGLEIAKEVTRQEKLSLADAKIINQLKKMKDLKHWEEKVKKIKNKKVRVFLQRYILKYLKRGIF
jgi:methionine synthase II (cobalamin-independent)